MSLSFGLLPPLPTRLFASSTFPGLIRFCAEATDVKARSGKAVATAADKTVDRIVVFMSVTLRVSSFARKSGGARTLKRTTGLTDVARYSIV